jgi:outer membrane cobalamin receptor
MLKQIITVVLFSSLSFSQNGDSLSIQDTPTGLNTTFTDITDTAFVSDTTKTVKTTAPADTLFPIQGGPLSDVSTIIDKRTFLFDNYRYTGDLLRSFNFNFIKDLGFIGYPHESFIYGVGNNAISYLQDGVLWNNRYTNSLDLNLVQSEDIDSIEIVPSPRGFLYGSYNNPVTVNFITRDFITREPYARVKFYEGPDGEAMIDGKFSAMVAKRWNFSLQLTNRSKDSTYENTDLSIWQFNTKLKYFLSNSINIAGWYYFVDSKQGLNGGVDVDSLEKIPPEFNIGLYSPQAPVLYPNQKLDVLQHNVGLRTLAKPFDNSKLDLSLYYRFERNKVNDVLAPSIYSPLNENKTFGALLNAEQKISLAELAVIANFEKRSINYLQSTESVGFQVDANLFSIAPMLSILLIDGNLTPSVFYKYSSSESVGTGRRKNSESLSVLGFDLRYRFFEDLFAYGGYSEYDCSSCQEKVKNLELSLNYDNNIFRFDIKWFKRNNLYLSERAFPNGYSAAYPQFGNLSGLGLVVNYKVWYLLFETNSSYYFNPQQDEIYGVPELSFVGGVFINDYFFHDNLDLKAGFRFYYFGNNNVYTRNWGVEKVNPTNKLDFTLAGEIQKVAIFYFIWENLFGNEYYITPYYPMPERNIRFGLAWELFN